MAGLVQSARLRAAGQWELALVDDFTGLHNRYNGFAVADVRARIIDSATASFEMHSAIAAAVNRIFSIGGYCMMVRKAFPKRSISSTVL